jgi:Ras GTPase-activating-like protein IQGAP2/3
MRSGIPSAKQKDVPFYQALDDPETRAVYIRRMCAFDLGVIC